METGPLTQLIAEDIRRVASEQSVEPIELTRAMYRRHGGTLEHKLEQVGGFALVKRTFFAKKIRAEGEVYASQQVNKAVNALRRDIGSRDYVAARIEALLEKMPPIKLAYRPKASKKRLTRSLSLLLSDLHVGTDLTLEEHLVEHRAKQEAAALWSVIKNVCEYKLEHRRDTELCLNILGDIIENELHGRSGADLLHVQVCRAIYLLSQAIAILAASFPKVRVNFSVGNHGRDIALNPGRATSQKFNGLETTIYYAIKVVCRGLKNVEFSQPLTAWAEYTAQGHKIYVTHGDTHLEPGNPGGKINVRGLENSTNRINASLKDKDEYKVFAVGHVHQAMVTQLVNGSYLITNGALIPPGSYAQSLNIMEAPMTQVLWETTKEHPVGDFRFVTANKNERNVKIKTFFGLDSFK